LKAEKRKQNLEVEREKSSEKKDLLKDFSKEIISN
jgi:hypothetical protein